MYVWVDALTNYLTGTNFPNSNYTEKWPADFHIIGKDILRFHAVYWPAFLMSANIELPKIVFAHGFLFNKGIKMSKSLGNVVSPSELINKYGIDQIRYFFLREVSLGNDGNYDDESITRRINADLANDLGNLIQRSCSMVVKNCNSVIPTPSENKTSDDLLIDTEINNLSDKIINYLEYIEINKILNDIWEQISALNKYFSDQKPWELRKTNPERMNTVLYTTIENIRKIAIMLQPVMPDSSRNILNLLDIDINKRTFRDIANKDSAIQNNTIGTLSPIFPKIEMSDE